MFADQAYSLHTLALLALIIVCLLSGAVLLALLGVKLFKVPLFWITAAIFLLLLTFAAVRFLLLIAPTEVIYHRVIKLQTLMGFVSALAPFLFLLALIFGKHSMKFIFVMFLMSSFNLLGVLAVLKADPISIRDFYPAVSYFIFCGFCIYFYKNLFPQLSHISLETFLNETHDLVLVFDNSNRLMKANSKAMETFQTHEDMNLQEFDAVLKELIGFNKDKTMKLLCLSERRYYQYSKTIVEKQSGLLLATVLMFFDVTEMTLLQAELRDRNRQLRIQGEKLKEYIKTLERLETEEQKEIIIHEIQQVMEEKMEKLTQEMESDQASQNLPGIIESCRGLMTEVRTVLSRLVKTDKGGNRDV